MDTHSSPKFVVIGGGTGSFALLSVLKQYVRDITALVNMADDGGSTGVLRDELGVLPPGDVRQCLVALSQSSEQMRQLFNYRFPEGTFAGHSFGNLFLSAVEKMTDNFAEAVDMAGKVLDISGKVVPITLDPCVLTLEMPDGTKMSGQYNIETYDVPDLRGAEIGFRDAVRLNPKARAAILEADVIVIAPGNLYISLAPALLVPGMREALLETKAQIAYVCNLVNKPIHTKDYAIHDYVAELERFIGKAGIIDHVLYNIDRPSQKVLDAYTLDGEFPVAVDEAELAKMHASPIPGKFLSRSKQERNQNDSFILRSLIRHDGDAIARALMRIYFS